MSNFLWISLVGVFSNSIIVGEEETTGEAALGTAWGCGGEREQK